MTGGTQGISIPVDLTNPGQFFACCGMFELADRLWPNAFVQAHFEPGRFCLTRTPVDRIGPLPDQFANAVCEQLDPKDNASSPLRMLRPFDLRLDWWVKSENNRVDLGGGGRLKTWAGKQLGPRIFNLMRKAAENAASEVSPLDYRTSVLDEGGDKAVAPFYFDSRREGTCLDFGFSPDTQQMSVESFPAVESLALVGLQRFRPYFDDASNPGSFLYTCWADPLPAVVAAVAACGLVPVRSRGVFRFIKPSRGGEYMTMFSRAKRERSSYV